MTKTTCSRCGKETAKAKIIPLSGTSRGATVCPACYTYLSESDIAYERFVIIERESKKKKIYRRTLKW